MSNAQAANTLSAASPYASNRGALAGYRSNGSNSSSGSGSAGSATSLLAAVADQTQVSGTDSTPVTLSDAARALSAGTSATGSSDFDNEASYLGGLAESSLAALGIVTPDQESGTQITFDSLSYNVSSSAYAGAAQAGGQTASAYGEAQQAQFIGQGEITTADGRTFDFQIEVDLGQSQQVEETGNSAGASALPATAALPSSSGASSSTSGVSSPGIASSGTASPGTASSGTASSDLINWSAILDQSKSLMALLESMGQATQAANAANSAASSSATANSAASAANGATSASAASGSTAGAASAVSQASAPGSAPDSTAAAQAA